MVPDVQAEVPGSLRGDDSSYTGYRRVGVRLMEEFDRTLVDSRKAMDSENDFTRGLQWFDKAHTVMLAEEGIIPRDGARACLGTLRALQSGDLDDTRESVGGGVHAGEAYLIQQLGMEVGGLIHAGRSSWDLGLVSHRVGLRDSILGVMTAVNAYRRALLDRSAEMVNDVMPYYTHGQQAQPTTLAHHLHAFVCAAERDWQRLDGAYRRLNVSAAGSAAGTASRFATNRPRVSELMGFETVSTNTRDSSYNSDHLWEMGAALSLLVSSLDFLCEELIVWMGNEFGLIRLADRYCSTSSIMTQKRNPTAAEHVQKISRRIAGRTPASFIAPDLVRSARETVEALTLCAGMIATLKVNPDVMLQRAVDSWAQAADLAAVLVQERGLSWRMAHQTVGVMVRLAEEEGVPAGHPTPELLDRAAVLFLGRPLSVDDDLLSRALDPQVSLGTRTATGSPGPAEMKRQIAASRALLRRDDESVSAHFQRLTDAEETLEAAIDRILA